MTSRETELHRMLSNLVMCFGEGPESEEWWEGWVDATCCDCTNPNHPHTEGQIRDTILQCARELLASFVGTPGSSLDAVAYSPDALEAVQLAAPLSEHEAVDAAAVFHELLKRDDPAALTRTIEHVLKMRYRNPTAVS